MVRAIPGGQRVLQNSFAIESRDMSSLIKKMVQKAPSCILSKYIKIFYWLQ